MRKSVFTILFISICISTYCQKNADLVKDFPYANMPVFNILDENQTTFFNEVWKDPKHIGDTTTELSVYEITQYNYNYIQIYKSTFHLDNKKNIQHETNYHFNTTNIEYILIYEIFYEYHEDNTIKWQEENNYDSSTGEKAIHSTTDYDENGNKITSNYVAYYDESQNSTTEYDVQYIDERIRTQKAVSFNTNYPRYTCDSFIYNYVDTVLTGFDKYTVYRLEELPAQIVYEMKYETRINPDIDTITTTIYEIVPGYSDSVNLLGYSNLIFSSEGDTININIEYYSDIAQFGGITLYSKYYHKYVVKDGLEIESHHEFLSLKDYLGGYLDSFTNPRAKSETHVYHTFNEDGEWISTKREFTGPNPFEDEGILKQTINYTSYIPDTLIQIMNSDIETPTAKDFHVFPNPCNNILNIRLVTYHNYSELNIVTLSGNMVLHKNVENTEFINLDIDNLAKGIYILQLKGNDIISIEKIIVY